MDFWRAGTGEGATTARHVTFSAAAQRRAAHARDPERAPEQKLALRLFLEGGALQNFQAGL